MRISDWSSDVCSSDLGGAVGRDHQHGGADHLVVEVDRHHRIGAYGRGLCGHVLEGMLLGITQGLLVAAGASADDIAYRSEEHTSELQSLMRISYAVFCLKKQTRNHNNII